MKITKLRLCTTLISAVAFGCSTEPPSSQIETGVAALSADLDTDGTVNLEDHIDIATFVVPSILEGGNNHLTFGYGGLSPRTYTAPLSGGRLLVGYNTDDRRGKVAVINGSDMVATHDVGSDGATRLELWGLVAHEDGAFGALLRDFSTMTMYMVKFDANGNQLWKTNLNRNGALPRFELGTKKVGDSRLAYGNGRYVAYYTIHAPNAVGQWHHKDQTMEISDDGVAHQTFGVQCSHAIGQLVAHHPKHVAGQPEFMTACTSDDLPAKGLHAKGRTIFASGGAATLGASAQLGQLAPAGNNWLLAFNAVTPYGLMYQGHGVALMKLDRSGRRIGSHKWMTQSANAAAPLGGNEFADPTLARIGGADDQELFLLGYRHRGAGMFLQVVDADGNSIVGAQNVAAFGAPNHVFWGRRDDSFRTTPEGDVVWVGIDKWYRDNGKLARRTPPHLKVYRFSKDAVKPPFSLSASALVSSTDSHIELTIAADDGLALPQQIDALQIEVFAADGTTSATQQLDNIALDSHGSVSLDMAAVDQHAKLRITATIDGKRATREIIALMLPDLAVAEIRSSEIVTVGETLNIEAVVVEQNQDLNAVADIILEHDGVEIDRARNVEIGAGADVSVAFTVELQTVGTHNLTVRVVDATPVDFEIDNDASNFTVAATPADNRQAVRYAMYYGRMTRDYNQEWSLRTSWYQSRGQTQYRRSYESLAFVALGNGQLTFPIDRIEFDVTTPGGEIERLVREDVEATRTLGSRGYYFEFDLETRRALYVYVSNGSFYSHYTRYASETVYFSESHVTLWGRTYSGSHGFTSGYGQMIRAEGRIDVDMTIEDDGQAFGGRATVELTTLPEIVNEWNTTYWWGFIRGHNNVTDRVFGSSYGMTEVGAE